MSTKAKFILTYVGGILTGVILVFVFSFVKQKLESNDVVWFEKPGQEIPSNNGFRVMQVMRDGSALACERWNSDFIVVFPASEDEEYYDSQVIEIEDDACVRQVGTYRYTSRYGMKKTIPIVEIFDK